jgi:hypothetical protein
VHDDDPWSRYGWQGIATEIRDLVAAAVRDALRRDDTGLARCCAIGQGLAALQQIACLQSNSPRPRGIRYNAAWLILTGAVPEIIEIPKTVRSDYVWCARHAAALAQAWSETAPEQRARWHHPSVIRRNLGFEIDEMETAFDAVVAEAQARGLTPEDLIEQAERLRAALDQLNDEEE